MRVVADPHPVSRDARTWSACYRNVMFSLSSLASTVGRVRIVGFFEGLSFLLLLGVAMPLKYIAGEPAMVKHLGMAHGVLFIGYWVTVVQAWAERGWAFKRGIWYLASAVIPAGPFIVDRELKKEQELEQQEAAEQAD